MLSSCAIIYNTEKNKRKERTLVKETIEDKVMAIDRLQTEYENVTTIRKIKK